MQIVLNRVSTNCRKWWCKNWNWWPRCRKRPEPESLTRCSVWAASCCFASPSWSGSEWRASLTVPAAAAWATPTSNSRNGQMVLPSTRPTVKVDRPKTRLISHDKSLLYSWLPVYYHHYYYYYYYYSFFVFKYYSINTLGGLTKDSISIFLDSFPCILFDRHHHHRRICSQTPIIVPCLQHTKKFYPLSLSPLMAIECVYLCVSAFVVVPNDWTVGGLDCWISFYYDIGKWISETRHFQTWPNSFVVICMYNLHFLQEKKKK